MTVDLSRKVNDLMCWTFEPRPDQPDRGDEQTAFFNSRHEGVTALIGGNGAGTTTLALAKIVDFMTYQQQAPRKDTPCWIIAGSYQQTMGTCWKEKLAGKGLLDPNTVDWERISWYKSSMNWPFAVPLKPRPDNPGKNWIIVFKSYEQGRAAMQAESIGAFCFVEQFEWSLLEEVMRGCREYAFRGNKIIEMTPVDPSKSLELRDMMENNAVPESWGIYHANTECAVEAGHVTKEWYRDFTSLIPENMIPVRTRGLFSNFEGAVYPEWNQAIHTIQGEWKCPSAWHHRRSVDWGFSVEHPLVCLWGCFDNIGNWVVYDEYWSNDTSKSVIDHWIEIDARHYWPKNSPYYGTTWVDHLPAAIHTLSKIHEYTNGDVEPPQMSLARKAVSEGIEHVKYLLKPTMQIEPGKFEPRLKIVKKNCPHLCKEMITYRYHKQLSDGVNAQAVRDEPVKIKDDSVDALRYLTFSEAGMKNITPSTMDHQHTVSSVQISSEKFKQKRTPKPRKSIHGTRE